MKHGNRSLALGLTLTLTACAALKEAPPEPAKAPAPPNVEEAIDFVQRVDQELLEAWMLNDRAAWVNQTYITDDTDWLAARSSENMMALKRDLLEASRRYKDLNLPPDVARQIELLALASTMPAPSDPALRRELATLATKMESTYGKGAVCLEGATGEACLNINEASKIIAESRDYDTLLKVWKGWREVAVPMRNDYERFVALVNQGAQEIGFENAGVLWRSGYDMSPEAFEQEVERLWEQVKPLYEALHCYVRARLSQTYGEDKVSKSGPIPAHLLGNMWAQEWSNIYPLVEPYPGEVSLNAQAQLKTWDATRMMKTGEAFFTSLGMPALPQTFWERSMLTKPQGRDVVCHASAWDIGGTNDVRIKMCTETTEEDLHTVHHELGHIYYYLHYYHLPPLFRSGAHDGFHEGIGDTLSLSITPAYLKSLGLLSEIPNNPKAELNTLMKRALDKIAFLPFGKMIDQWRWEVFDGRTTPAEYNSSWWKLRQQYQGVAAPEPRTEEQFDPGAKYHIPANVPYTRYFLAHILQFQFHRALCEAAGHEGPLHACSIYGSKEAGAKLAAMLKLGRSKPWPDALEQLTGTREMDASAVIDYFAPLMSYLQEQNQGESCGW